MEYLGKFRKLKILEEPTLLFGKNEKVTTSNLVQSMTNYGPWDWGVQTRDFNNITIVPLVLENLDQKPVQKILNNIENIEKYQRPTLQEFFRLNRVDFEEPIYYNKQNLDDKIDQIISDYPIDFSHQEEIITLTITDEDKINPNNSYAYYYSKERLINAGYPNQHISLSPEGPISRLISDPYPWTYVCRNLQLQIYIKSSGIPWVLNQRDQSPNISIGFGFAIIPDEFKYAIANVSLFESNGRWNNMRQSKYKIPEDTNWSEGLYIPKIKVKSLLNELLVYYKQKASELKPLVSIHKHGKFAQDEILGIEEVMNSKSYDFNLIEITNSSIRLGKLTDHGSYDPIDQYSWIELTTYSGLLVNTSSGKRSIGMPSVLKILRHKISSSPSNDIEISAQHVSDLTYMGWREFFAEGYRLPASVEFARMAANLQSRKIIPADRLLMRPWFA